ISVGFARGCAVEDDGGVRCWGSNEGAVPADMHYTLPQATAAPDVGGATQVSAGDSQVCAIGPKGAVLCWGNAYNGELGIANPAAGQVVTVPMLPAAAVEVQAVSRCSCARLSD